jgi:hypothetical protein
MKREIMLLFVLMFSSATLAETACDLDVSLLNQDPYPAVPGDYVKLVFQIAGIDSSKCNDIIFHLLEDYPIEFDPGDTGLRTILKTEFIKDYQNNVLVPYEIRVDKNALDGLTPIEFSYQSRGNAAMIKTINIEVEDARADFEVYIKNYDYSTRELTLEILNIEDVDVEAVIIEIPKQESIEIKGSNKMIVGDIDSNEYTTADFEAIPNADEIMLNISYSDSIKVRRTIQKTIQFDPSYFINRSTDEEKTNPWFYVVLLILAVWIIKIIYKKVQKKS